MNKKIVKSSLAAGLAAAIAVAVVVVAATSAGGGSPSHTGPAGEAPQPERRAVLVSRNRMPAPSQPGSSLRALRVSGPLPNRPSAATVLTDEDCSPDASGVSHCLNRIRLAGGETLSVRHPHRMMEIPCLSPGERVTIRPA